MDGCKRRGRMSSAVRLRSRISPSRICIPGSPAFAPGARRAPEGNRQPGRGGGPRAAGMPATPNARPLRRRLLQPATVAMIADRLRPGGVLHAATDHAGYAEQIAEVGDAEPRLRRVSASDTLPISVQRPVTKYEGKAQHAGSAV